MKFHLYADDTQLYLAFDGTSNHSKELALEQIERCISDIKIWMLINKLKLNEDKTEYLQFHPFHRNTAETVSTVINSGDDIVKLSDMAKNLGVVCDNDLSLSRHITTVVKVAHFQLYLRSCIRKYLMTEDLKIAVHSLISSCLDYFNSLLIRLPHAQINRLQHVMKCTAQLISGVGKFDHITPVLKSLHWLPVELRIKFKVLCLVYKALHGLGPSYLSETFARYQPARSLRSAGQDLLVVPKIRTDR